MPPSDAPTRFVATTRRGLAVRIDVAPEPGSDGTRWRATATGSALTRPVTPAVACETVAGALDVVVLMLARDHLALYDLRPDGEPPRAQLLADRAALRAEAARLRESLAITTAVADAALAWTTAVRDEANDSVHPLHAKRADENAYRVRVTLAALEIATEAYWLSLPDEDPR